MKYALILLFVCLFNQLNAQFSLSGGYIRRTEVLPFDLYSYFGFKKPPSDLALFNFYYLKGMYQLKSGESISLKFGGFSPKKIDYQFYESFSSGGGNNGFYNRSKTQHSIVSYYGLNIGIGLHFLLKKKNPSPRKIRSELKIGALLEIDLTYRSSEKNHRTSFYESYTSPWFNPNPNTVILTDSTSYAPFPSIKKSTVFSSVGIVVNERVVYKSRFFLEFQLNITITSSYRLRSNQVRSTSYGYEYKERFDGKEVEVEKGLRPILETGIGMGYVFPTKKKKTN